MTERARVRELANILLVEDNPGDVRLTEEAFSEGRISNTLTVATDGVEAMDVLYRRGEHADAPRPDVVLLDLDLPRKHGEAVLAEIRDDPALENLPVVVLTGSAAEEDVARAYELEANAVLEKPVDPEAFVEVVQSFQSLWLSVVRLPPVDDP